MTPFDRLATSLDFVSLYLNLRQQTPTPVSRPQTPLKVETPTPATPQPPPARSDEIIQPQVVQVAPAVQSEDPDSPIITTTVSETNMNTVSEGEWILKSDGQLTPDSELFSTHRFC